MGGMGGDAYPPILIYIHMVYNNTYVNYIYMYKCIYISMLCILTDYQLPALCMMPCIHGILLPSIVLGIVFKDDISKVMLVVLP